MILDILILQCFISFSEFFVFILTVISGCFQEKETGLQLGGLSPTTENHEHPGQKDASQCSQPAQLNQFIVCSFSSQLNRILKMEPIPNWNQFCRIRYSEMDIPTSKSNR